MKLKKAWIGIGLMLCTLLTGCGAKESVYVVNPVDGVNYNNSSPYGDKRILKGENGFYYNAFYKMFELHYYDESSRQSVFLCSRPECLHNGEEFCTATGTDSLNDVILYDGKLYCLTYSWDEEDNTQLVLLRVEPDGSGRTKLATLATPKAKAYRNGHLFIHRGIVFASYDGMTEEKEILGMVTYNLLDGTITNFPEYTFTHSLEGYHFDECLPNYAFMCAGNYVYYNEYRPGESRKNKLFICRYDIETGEVTDYLPSEIYKGVFCVTEEDEIVYSDKFGNIFTYNFATQEKQSFDKLLMPTRQRQEDGTYILNEVHKTNVGVGDFFYYKGELYAFLDMSMHFQQYVDMNWNKDGSYYVLGAIKLDQDMKQVGEILVNPIHNDEIREYLFGSEETGYSDYNSYMLHILDDSMYLQSDRGVVRLSLEDYLNGTLTYDFLMRFMEE